MRRKTILAVLIIVCWLATIPQVFTHAQPASTPLILAIGGNSGSQYDADLWEWTGTDQPLQQLTHYGHNGSPIISPNGRYVAFLSLPIPLMNYLMSLNWVAAGEYAANVWMLDLATGNATQIADQPPDYDGKLCGILRSKPVWSPDSRYLAWTEYGTDGEQLKAYDLVNGLTRILSTEMGMDNYPVQPIWSDGGIALSLVAKDNNNINQLYIRTFDATGKVLFSVPGTSDWIVFLRWVKDVNGEYIRIGDLRPNIYTPPIFINPTTGEQTSRTDAIELYSLAAPAGLSVFWTGDCHGDGGCSWMINVSGQAAIPIDAAESIGGPGKGPYSSGFFDYDDNIAIAPDGRQVAFLNSQQNLLIYQNGQPQTVTLPPTAGEIEALTWGAMGWRVWHGQLYLQGSFRPPTL